MPYDLSMLLLKRWKKKVKTCKPNAGHLDDAAAMHEDTSRIYGADE